jgi:hypothetical protein
MQLLQMRQQRDERVQLLLLLLHVRCKQAGQGQVGTAAALLP